MYAHNGHEAKVSEVSWISNSELIIPRVIRNIFFKWHKKSDNLGHRILLDLRVGQMHHRIPTYEHDIARY